MTWPLEQPALCPVLVGRAPALAALERRVERAWAGQGTTVILAGEAGIGKSRLVAEMTERARQRCMTVLQGHCFEPYRSVPYAPLLELLRMVPASRDGAELAPILAPLANDLLRLLPELTAYLPAIPDQGAHPPPSVNAGREQYRLFDAMAQLFTQLAVAEPLLVVIEDLHWSDDTSLDLLLYLARRVLGSRLLLLLTYRNDEIYPRLGHFLASLDRNRLATELTLSRLAPADVEMMCRAIFDEQGVVPPALMYMLQRLTDGNPFFIEETLKVLLMAGDLDYADGVWVFTQPSSWRIPRSVQDAVQQRMARLKPTARHVLGLAAVAGQRVDFALLQALAGLDEDALVEQIKELIDAQLLVEVAVDRFAFRHALTCQAVKAQLLRRERQQFHQAILQTLERLYPDAPDAHLAELAYHAHEAGAWQSALFYARKAGERALALGAAHEAAEQLTRALGAASHLAGVATTALHHVRGQALELLGDLDGARTDYEAALELARAGGDRRSEWQALLHLGAFWAASDYARAGEYLRPALDLARALGNRADVAHNLNRLGNWLANTGDSAAGVQAHREALALFETASDQRGQAATLDLLGMATVFSGDRVAATSYLDRAVELFRSLGDHHRLVSCLAARGPFAAGPALAETTYAALWSAANCLRDADEAARLAEALDWPAGQAFIGVGAAPTCADFGEYGAALMWASETLRIATQIGHRQWLVGAHSALGSVYIHLYRSDLAVQHLETGLALAQELGSTWWVSMCTVSLVMTWLLKGDLRRAETVLASAYPPTINPPAHPANLASRRLAWAQAELALRRGDPARALRTADELLGSIPGDPLPQPIPALQKVRGSALAALGRLEEAAAAFEEAWFGAEQRGLRPLLWQIQRDRGRLHERRKERQAAQHAFATAQELIASLAATIPGDADREHFGAAALATLPRERAPTPLRAARQAYGGLTRREREVAALIAQGKSNFEIAAELFLGEGTVATHVSNILNKLDYTSRVQIAAWAVEHGLARPDVT